MRLILLLLLFPVLCACCQKPNQAPPEGARAASECHDGYCPRKDQFKP